MSERERSVAILGRAVFVGLAAVQADSMFWSLVALAGGLLWIWCDRFEVPA